MSQWTSVRLFAYIFLPHHDRLVIKKFMTKNHLVDSFAVPSWKAGNFRASLTNNFSLLSSKYKKWHKQNMHKSITRSLDFYFIFLSRKKKVGLGKLDPNLHKTPWGWLRRRRASQCLHVKESIVVSLCIISPERITNFVDGAKYQQAFVEHL